MLIGPLVGLIVLAVSVRMAGAVDEEKGPQRTKRHVPNIGMKTKLEASEKILAAIREGDFGSLSDSAKAIQTLNEIEYFVRNPSPEYQVQLRVFQFATNELLRNADERNSDGATLGFTQMTISCVRCYKHLRKN